MTETVIVISVLTMLAVGVIGFVVQHQIDRHGTDDQSGPVPTDAETDSDTGAIELPRPSA